MLKCESPIVKFLFMRTGRTTTKDVTGQHLMHNAKMRVAFVFGFIALLIFLSVVRLFWMQAISHDKYTLLAQQQHLVDESLQGARGPIYFRNSDKTFYPAAVDREYFVAFVSEPDVSAEQKDSVSWQISQELGVEYDFVRRKLDKVGDPYEIVKRKISREEKDRLSDLSIDGLAFHPERRRFYPGETLGAHLIGFVGSDGENVAGRYGAESYFEENLLAKDGRRKGLRDARGGWITTADRSYSPYTDGASVVLTIERDLQHEIEKILQEDVRTYDAEKGVVVVMEVQTGKVLAMAQTPTYSINEYGSVEDLALFRNLSVQDSYESGSVFKTFTIAMGLDAGKITPESTYVDEGFVQADVFKIRNAEGKVYGLQTMTKVLEDSINTGVVHVQKLLGNELFKEYSEQFGFGSRTGIELPGEIGGDFSQLDNTKRFVEYYTASYGQGVTVTPMQLVAAYGALANGGIMMRPSILEGIGISEGEQAFEPQEVRRVISEEASIQIGEMLYQVVEGGHAKLAEVPGYKIGGKTGTAQVVNSDTGGYDEEKKNTTFVGYGPIDDETDPMQYVVLVRYDNPRAAEWAATSAAPTFGRVMKFLMDYKRIPPTEEIVTGERVFVEPANVVD